MSIVERALENLRHRNPGAGLAAVGAGQPHTGPSERLAATPGERSQAARFRSDAADGWHELDLEALAEAGMVVPGRESSVLAEEMRLIKRGLAKVTGAQAGTGPLLIAVTSAGPGEGKSFVAANLALSIAMEPERRVLLVDADTTRPGISRMLGLPTSPGLTDLLHDDQRRYSEVTLRTNLPALTLMPPGTPYPQFAELFSGSRMRMFCEGLRGAAAQTVVLFDAPPVLASSVGSAVANLVDETLMVIAAESSEIGRVTEALGMLESARSLRLVVNKVRSGTSVGGYYSY